MRHLFLWGACSYHEPWRPHYVASHYYDYNIHVRSLFLLLLPCVAAALVPLYGYLLFAGPIHACLNPVDTAYLFVWPVSMRGHSRVCLFANHYLCLPSKWLVDKYCKYIDDQGLVYWHVFEGFSNKFWVAYSITVYLKALIFLVLEGSGIQSP